MTKKVTMAEAEKPKRRGRPRIPAEQKKRTNLTFRVRDDLREKVQVAAEESSRSLSEEVEYRLEQSFNQQSVLAGFLGGEHNVSFFRILGMIVDDIERHTKGKWREDEKTSLHVAASIIAALQGIHNLTAKEIFEKIIDETDERSWLNNATILANIINKQDMFRTVKIVNRNIETLINAGPIGNINTQDDDE